MSEYNDVADENNEDSVDNITDEEMTHRFREAVRLENERKEIIGVPVQKYDYEKKKPYLEYPNKEREYVE